MSVFVNTSTRVFCQGISGGQRVFHIELVNAYGAKMQDWIAGSRAAVSGTVGAARG
jgi:succinyl-CoA synthetase alpha subunit